MIGKDYVRESFGIPEDDPFKMKVLLTANCVHFVNDSRSTNVNATWYAIEETPGPIVWIAGGIDKANDYSTLVDLVRSKVHAIVVLGGGYEKLHHHFGQIVQGFERTSDMRQAVRIAHTIARDLEGHPTVLLSPACASFDLFEDLEDRGRHFNEAVREWYLS